MKKLIFTVSVLMVAVGAYGQGQFFFSNRDIASGVNARFVFFGDPGNWSSVGIDYTVTLLGGPRGETVSLLVPLSPSTTTMRGAAGTALAGYVMPMTVTVPNVPIGASADILVKVSGRDGAQVWIFNVPALGGGVFPPPTLPMGLQPLEIGSPEPKVLILEALGLGGWLIIHRRRQSS